MLTKIISGGQTGADQGGLDAALYLGLETGGYIPKGRRTEYGPMPIEQFKCYKLSEHFSSLYSPRTSLNVQDSDGTAIFGYCESPGSKATIKFCLKYKKPYIKNPNKRELVLWITQNRIKCLNVAGNRESKNPGIHDRVLNILVAALSPFKAPKDEFGFSAGSGEYWARIPR